MVLGNPRLPFDWAPNSGDQFGKQRTMFVYGHGRKSTHSFRFPMRRQMF